MTETTDSALTCSQCGVPFPDPISARDSDVQEFICACGKGKVTYGPLHRADRIVMLDGGGMEWASWEPADASGFYYIDAPTDINVEDCHAYSSDQSGFVIG